MLLLKNSSLPAPPPPPRVNFYHFHELSCLLERSDSTKLAQGRAGDHWGKRTKEGTGDKKEEEEIEKDCSF